MRIAIIGAGLTGACLANSLRSSHTVEVFEKSRGPGGRMSTRRTDDWKVDHGAQFFTIRDSRFEAIAEPMIRIGVIRPWNPRLAIFNNNNWILDQWKEEHYVAAPSMNSACNYLLENIEVHYQTEILEISGNPMKWELRTNEDYFGFFDLVISTLPAPQATKLLPSECQFIKEISAVHMEPCIAFFAKLKEHLDLGWDAAIVKNSPVHWMAMNHSKPGRNQLTPTFVMHLQPEFSAQNYQLDLNSWCIETMASLCQIHPSQVEELYCHKWRYARASIRASQLSFYDRNMGIAAAGDWGPGERVEGAVISALDLIKDISKSSSDLYFDSANSLA